MYKQFKKFRYDLKYRCWDNFIEEKKPRILWWWLANLVEFKWPFVRPPKRMYDYSQSKPHKRDMKGRKYFSQAGQDLFVLDMLGGKKEGIFVEIGGADPFESNNTFLLESDFRWFGISVEFDAELAARYNRSRRAICFNADATRFDFTGEIAKRLNNPARVDYLSADIDPAENTYNALKKLPLDNLRFSVITYEHDNYASGPRYMNLSRKLLQSHGYILVCSNVNCFGRDFEDWWVDPQVVSEDVWRKYKSSNKEFAELFA